MPGKIPDYLYQAYKLLGQEIGTIEPFLKETSCMSYDERLAVAYCHAYKLLFPDDKEFIKFLDKKAGPILQKIGHAKWMRTELTDLALKKGLQVDSEDVTATLGKRQ